MTDSARRLMLLINTITEVAENVQQSEGDRWRSGKFPAAEILGITPAALTQATLELKREGLSVHSHMEN